MLGDSVGATHLENTRTWKIFDLNKKLWYFDMTHDQTISET